MLFSPSFCYFFLYIRIFFQHPIFTHKKNMFLPEGKRADFTPEKKSIILFVVLVGRTNCVNENLRLEFITLLREVTLCSYLEKRTNKGKETLSSSFPYSETKDESLSQVEQIPPRILSTHLHLNWNFACLIYISPVFIVTQFNLCTST
jgi:hypothetical protein